MQTIKHNLKHTELLFDNFTEFCNFTAMQAIKDRNATGHDSNQEFRHTRNLAECMGLASTGWPDGRKSITKILDTLNVANRVKVPELYFDVTGDYGLDMGLYAAGEPECAIAFRETEIDSPNTSGSIVKLTVNATISAMVDKEIYMQRGAAIVALIDTLETAGKRVELNVVWTCTNIRGTEHWTLNIPLKTADTHVQLDQIAFCLVHPSFVRRMCFIAHGAISPAALESSATYCGYPADYKNEGSTAIIGSPDIYFPRMYGTEPQWENTATCKAWVVNKLKELGVELENENEGHSRA